MGIIKISVAGSFKTCEEKSFTAMDTGHADAVARAIEYLSRIQLPEAIREDIELSRAGESPRLGFAERKFGKLDPAHHDFTKAVTNS